MLGCCVLGHSQNFKLEEGFEINKISNCEINSDFFTVIGTENSRIDKYEYRVYSLKDTVTEYLTKFDSEIFQDLELYHKTQNHLVLIFSAKKKTNRFKNKPSYSATEKDYSLVSINLIDKRMQVEKLDVEKPDKKFSGDDFSCFMYLENKEIKTITIKDVNLKKESKISLPKEIYKKYKDLEISSLKVVSNKTYLESIGIPENRIFYDSNNIYLNYLFPKKRVSLILKLQRIEENFVWLGYHELEFGIAKKTKDYNAFIARDYYYFLVENKKQVMFRILDLEKSVSREYMLNDLADLGKINSDVFNKVVRGVNFLSNVPSLVVHKEKNNDNAIVSISYISKETNYNDGFMFHQQMFQQQMMRQQQMMMQNIRVPSVGGFKMVSIPRLGDEVRKEDKTLKFIVQPNQEIVDYNDEKTALENYDPEKDYKYVSKILKQKIKGKLEYFSFVRLKENEKFYHVFYDKKNDKIVFGTNY
ncbi:hypothetical protein Q4595_08795 [Wenyingzhuangia sp. 1_MG-2023]|nr:hypothetical protein [Wenyingzhuangia sp. 1_MG-2023]